MIKIGTLFTQAHCSEGIKRSSSALDMKKFVVDQPLTIHLQHPKGVQEDHPEIGLAKPDGRGVASDLNREDLQHGLGTGFGR